VQLCKKCAFMALRKSSLPSEPRMTLVSLPPVTWTRVIEVVVSRGLGNLLWQVLCAYWVKLSAKLRKVSSCSLKAVEEGFLAPQSESPTGRHAGGDGLAARRDRGRYLMPLRNSIEEMPGRREHSLGCPQDLELRVRSFRSIWRDSDSFSLGCKWHKNNIVGMVCSKLSQRFVGCPYD